MSTNETISFIHVDKVDADAWECSQCGKKCGRHDQWFEDGVCEKCNAESTRVSCPICEAVYSSDEDIYIENGVNACQTCHEEMVEARKASKASKSVKGIKKVRKNM